MTVVSYILKDGSIVDSYAEAERSGKPYTVRYSEYRHVDYVNEMTGRPAFEETKIIYY